MNNDTVNEKAAENQSTEEIQAVEEKQSTEPLDGAKITDEMIIKVLSDGDRMERLVMSDEGLCNKIISRYLDELSGRTVPIVKGFSALSPVPKPKTLGEAKSIVDAGGG